MMSKLACGGILLIVIVAGCFYFFQKTKYNNRINNQIMMYPQGAINNLVVPYYLDNGEYPLEVVTDDNALKNNDKSLNVKYDSHWLTDDLRSDGGCVKYYPLYNPSNGKRESFIVLSAGVDGAIDNYLSIQDTLFMDSWWEVVKTYNLAEFLAIKYMSDIHGIFPTRWVYENYDEGFPQESYLKAYPSFSLCDYLFGKRDLLIQVDSLPFRSNLSYRFD